MVSSTGAHRYVMSMEGGAGGSWGQWAMVPLSVPNAWDSVVSRVNAWLTGVAQ